MPPIISGCDHLNTIIIITIIIRKEERWRVHKTREIIHIDDKEKWTND